MASGTIKSVVPRSDIVNNLTTNDSTKVLSAAQGKALNDKLDSRVSTHDFGSVTVAGFESGLVSLISSNLTSNGYYCPILANISAASGVFSAQRYIGWVFKQSASHSAIFLVGTDNQNVTGHYNSSGSGTWTWESLNSKTIQNTESFSSLSTFKTFLANMTVGKAVDIITSSEVSTAIAGSTYICSGIATKIDSSFVDINWIRGDSAVGSTRYKISSQTFTINDINSKLDNKANRQTTVYSNTTLDSIVSAFNTAYGVQYNTQFVAYGLTDGHPDGMYLAIRDSSYSAKTRLIQFSGDVASGSYYTLDSINFLNNRFSFNITSNTDLNTLTTPGFYGCATGAIATTLVNCPVSVNFTMLVIAKGELRNQVIFVGGVDIYARAQSSSGYGDWFNFHGTRV